MACSKKPYRTKRAAIKARNKTGIAAWLRIYFCRKCQAYHLTSQPRRNREP